MASLKQATDRALTAFLWVFVRTNTRDHKSNKSAGVAMNKEKNDQGVSMQNQAQRSFMVFAIGFAKGVTTEERVSQPPTNRKRKQISMKAALSRGQDTIFILHDDRSCHKSRARM